MQEEQDQGPDREPTGFWATLARDPEVVIYFGMAVAVAA